MNRVSANMSREVGDYIREHARELSEKVVQAQYDAEPGLEECCGATGREQWLQDTGQHLVHLAAAVAFEAPELFVAHVGWAKGLLAGRESSQEHLARCFETMSMTLLRELPAAYDRVVRPYLQEAMASFPKLPWEPVSFLNPSTPLAPLAEEYLARLLQGDAPAAIRAIISKVEEGVSLRDIYEQVITVCMREVGRLWQTRAITEAQEHYCSNSTVKLLMLLTWYFKRPTKERRVFLGLCVPDELHDLGLRTICDSFEQAGWDVAHVGANVPIRNFPAVLRLWQPDVVGLSVTLTPNLAHLKAAIDAVRQCASGGWPKILIGGRPFDTAKSLWKKFDADSWAENGEQAVAWANEMVKLRPAATLPVSMTHDAGREQALMEG